MSVQRRELLHWTHLQPLSQAVGLARVQRVQRRHWQSEVIYKVAVLRDLFRNRVVFVNFWQDFCVVRSQDLTYFIQQIPDFWFNEEVIGTDLLNGIGKSVQTNQVGPVLNHVSQRLLKEFLSYLTLNVDVDLFFTKRVPQVFNGTIVKLDFLHWCLVLTLVDQVNVFFGRTIWTSSCPELFPTNEEVVVLGVVMVLLEVLVHNRLLGNVVDHEVKHQVVFFTQCFNVSPVTKSWINNRVVIRCKATVTS